LSIKQTRFRASPLSSVSRVRISRWWRFCVRGPCSPPTVSVASSRPCSAAFALRVGAGLVGPGSFSEIISSGRGPLRDRDHAVLRNCSPSANGPAC